VMRQAEGGSRCDLAWRTRSVDRVEPRRKARVACRLPHHLTVDLI
jgi:hypothetical protein